MDNPLGRESKKTYIKIKPPGSRYDNTVGLIESVCSFLMSTKNKNASYCTVISSSWVTGSDPWPQTHWPPLTHFHLWSPRLIVRITDLLLRFHAHQFSFLPPPGSIVIRRVCWFVCLLVHYVAWRDFFNGCLSISFLPKTVNRWRRKFNRSKKVSKSKTYRFI